MPRARQRSSELEAQAALAGARLGDDADDLAVARACACASAASSVAHVGGAADEAREAAGARDVEARARRADADAGDGRAPARATPLTRNVAEIVEREVAADQRRRRAVR